MSSRQRLILLAAGLFILLAGAAAVLVLKGGSPSPQAQTQVQEAFPTAAQSELQPSPQLQTSSRETSHLFFPASEADRREKPAAAPPEEQPEGFEESADGGPMEGMSDRPAAKDAGVQRKEAAARKKLSIQGMGSGGAGRNSGGEMGGVSYPAPPAAGRAGGAVKPPLEGFASGNVAPNMSGVSQEPQGPGDTMSPLRQKRSNTSDIKESQISEDHKKVTAFSKDPKGERSTTADEVRPGLIQMDNGQWIHVIEVGGVSQGAGTKTSGGKQ